ncbi:hypothetical protein CSZ94_21065 [Janthinobacterium sp. ROICE36]|nr:hypothetical protein CSZ94_21065 [Janthinobacterium sp. ROICE36]
MCVVSLGRAQEHAPPPAVPAPLQSASVPPPAAPATPAASTEDAAPSQTVTITANSDARAPRIRFTAYRESYLTARKVWQASSGSVVMALRLIPAKLSATIDDVRVALQGNGAPVPIKVSDGGVFVVPLNEDIAAQDGSFLVNKGRGELTASIVLQPSVARDAWNVTRVGQVLRDARRAVRAITPWYKRPFANDVQSLAFCATERGSALQLMDGEQLIATLPMDEAAVNDINQPVFCKIFDGEDKYPGHYRVVLPEQATVLLL